MTWLLSAALALLPAAGPASAHEGHAHEHPDVAIRIDEALLESPAVVEAQQRALEDKIRDFKLLLREDGLHAKGKYRVPILPDVSFEAVAAFVWVRPDVFHVRVRKFKVLGFIDATQRVLDAMQKALEESLKDAVSPNQLGEDRDGSRVLEVTVDLKKVLPLLPGLYLSGITTRDKVLILKARLP